MSTTTLTTKGSNTAVTLNNTLLSTVNFVNWNYTYNISYSVPKDILVINDTQGQTILKIDNTGSVSWQGSANQSARRFVNMIQHQIDNQVVGPAAQQRSYLRGMEKCLQMSQELEPDLFCEKLKTEIQSRRQKVMLQEISGK
tara:strand:- start:13298 stop:13723 length:426 start_codon:yes stop_codon:yes gene_type:complete